MACALVFATLWLGCGDSAQDTPGGTGAQAPSTTGGQGQLATGGTSAGTSAGTGTGTSAGTGAGATPSPTGGAGSNRPDGSATQGDSGPTNTADAAATPTAAIQCAPRVVQGAATLRFHHVHFNTPDVAADLRFFEDYLDAPAIDFCTDAISGAATKATRTERGYFLYTEVATPPDPALNTYLEHVGWIHPSPTDELHRLRDLGAVIWPEGRAQCVEAAAGEMACTLPGFVEYWFYLQAPSGARIEVAKGPGPATSGFGHVHMIMGTDLSFFATVSDGAFDGAAIDDVNHTLAGLQENILATEMVVDTRGKPIDHIAYSTTDLEAARMRIMDAGIAIEEDIAFKPEYGFESFFVRSPKGIWVEIVGDAPFAP